MAGVKKLTLNTEMIIESELKIMQEDQENLLLQLPKVCIKKKNLGLDA